MQSDCSLLKQCCQISLPKSSQKSSQPGLKIAQFLLRESNQPIPKVAQIIVNKMEKQHTAIFH